MELTESLFIGNDETGVAYLFNGLKATGVRIAIDDFGTGYSSLSYLERLSIDCLKIDHSFTSRIESEGSRAASLTAAVIDVGERLGLETVAEGVETTTQWDMLRAMGCQRAQGYLFCRPAPIADLNGMADLFRLLTGILNRRGLILMAVLIGFASNLAGDNTPTPHVAQVGAYPSAYLVDVTGSHGLDEVMSLSPAAWKPLTSGGVSFGYDPAVYWFTWNYRAQPGTADSDVLVEIAYPMLDEIDLFAIRGQGREWMVIDQWRMGDSLPFAARPYPHPNFVVPIRVAPGTDIQFVARVRTSSSVQVPVRLWSEAAFAGYAQFSFLSIGAFIGTLLSLLLYHFVVWLTLREPLYLYFMIWIVFAGAVVVTLIGLGFQYVWLARRTGTSLPW